MKILFTILTALLLSYSASAQQAQIKKLSKEERSSHIAKSLSVDKKKAGDIVDALDYNVEKIQATMRDTTMKPQQRRELVMKLHQERQAKIKATMSAEEYAKMQAAIAPIIAERKANAEAQRKEQLKKIEQKGKAQKEVIQEKKP